MARNDMPSSSAYETFNAKRETSVVNLGQAIVIKLICKGPLNLSSCPLTADPEASIYI